MLDYKIQVAILNKFSIKSFCAFGSASPPMIFSGNSNEKTAQHAATPIVQNPEPPSFWQRHKDTIITCARGAAFAAGTFLVLYQIFKRKDPSASGASSSLSGLNSKIPKPWLLK